MRKPSLLMRFGGKPRPAGYSRILVRTRGELDEEAVSGDCAAILLYRRWLSACRLQLQLFQRQSSWLHSEVFPQGLALQDERRGAGHDHGAGRRPDIVDLYSPG